MVSSTDDQLIHQLSYQGSKNGIFTFFDIYFRLPPYSTYLRNIEENNTKIYIINVVLDTEMKEEHLSDENEYLNLQKIKGRIRQRCKKKCLR